jgi:hypothetical protein
VSLCFRGEEEEEEEEAERERGVTMRYGDEYTSQLLPRLRLDPPTWSIVETILIGYIHRMLANPTPPVPYTVAVGNSSCPFFYYSLSLSSIFYSDRKNSLSLVSGIIGNGFLLFSSLFIFLYFNLKLITFYELYIKVNDSMYKVSTIDPYMLNK